MPFPGPYLVPLATVTVVLAEASDEYVEDNDMLLLPVVPSDRLFTSDADGVISVIAVATELLRCSVQLIGLISPRGPVMVEISSPAIAADGDATVVVVALPFGLVPEVVAVDIELDDCEEEFKR